MAEKAVEFIMHYSTTFFFHQYLYLYQLLFSLFLAATLPFNDSSVSSEAPTNNSVSTLSTEKAKEKSPLNQQQIEGDFGQFKAISQKKAWNI